MSTSSCSPRSAWVGCWSALRTALPARRVAIRRRSGHAAAAEWQRIPRARADGARGLAGAQAAFDLHHRLRPRLRRTRPSASRLAAGSSSTRAPPLPPRSLGEDAWELVRRDRPSRRPTAPLPASTSPSSASRRRPGESLMDLAQVPEHSARRPRRGRARGRRQARRARARPARHPRATATCCSRTTPGSRRR